MERTKPDIIFGLRAVIEALKAGKELDKVLIQQKNTGELMKELSNWLKKTSTPYQVVPIEKLNRVTRKNHQGVIAFASAISYQNIELLVPQLFENGETPLILILDRITDVRNFGAIARTASCSGVHAILVPSRGAAQINGDAIKTSAGALHDLPVCRAANLKQAIEYLKNSGIQIVACSEKAKGPYYECDLSLPTAIIMGSEEDGISEEYLKLADTQVEIPMKGKIGSLNVSVATGIVLFEANKQRLVSNA